MVELIRDRSGFWYQTWCLEHQYDIITGESSRSFFGDKEWLSMVRKWIHHYWWIRWAYSDIHNPLWLRKQYKTLRALLWNYRWARLTYYLNFIWVNQTPLLPP